MENKINIAELLKDCPIGMELDCAMYDNCTYEGIEDNGYIDILINTPSGRIRLTKEGCYIRHDDNAKCVIFPKGKTTWEGFVPPCEFKDGDIVATADGFWIGITAGGKSGKFMPTYCVITGCGEFEVYLNHKETWQFHRLATEEEKTKLFQTIKDNGYKWNSETKTLEKLITPKFKVGNRVKSKINQHKYTIADIKKDGYIIYYYYGSDILEYHVPFCNENDFKLVSDNFDIDTLKPFDKVLARCSTSDKWRIQFFEKYDRTSIYPFICMGYNKYKQCVPYEGNEHLLDTNNNCDEYFKTW